MSALSIDIEKYLQDIDPDNVCGDDLEYDPAFIALEQAIIGKPEQEIGDTIQEAEPPDWKEIKKSAEALLDRTRDLRVLVYYLRSLIALEGLTGLSEGLKLIDTLIAKHWDAVYPRLDPDDDNDPTERVNILMALCDHETMLRPLQLVSLVESKALGRFCFRDFMIAAEKMTVSEDDNAPKLGTIEAAVQDSDIAALQSNLASIVASAESLNSLEDFVTQQVGINNAPNFEALRHLLKEFEHLLSGWLESRGVDDIDAPQVDPESQDEMASRPQATKKSISGAINNSQDVLNALKLICDYYKKNEPSSPVPLLLERAQRLVGKSFMDALMDIAPDGVSQASIIMGAKSEDE
ncbi:type VI secretion system protein TssA [Methylotuvimicrobium alcaliphilum]|uniref:Type VI secretion-associated protein, ImpA family n=1 Tax=Methylotuvimicrobium alcaliphilum (strain DSM 19304 / NCIMB 14124 / VKM B-2133 / 20Z) TaxID=1091494 RepID=G4T2W3_META2|nr:type VI secretion system protein TssA [Methylotuvimicrobium alcaliphilum]CCE23616.1 putative Type VI secretion-associated protein, ImpA family [Methylotuvimicrobium alcaliphilum 20Z]